MVKKTIELLSPVGSFDCLQAAIKAGADAIYFGVEQLNMRTRSSGGFSISDIQEVAAICKKAGIRSYITLNTVMYEHDMQLLQTILKEVKKRGIDAVIASDFAVIEYCRQLQIPLHISTQANVSNIEAVQFFSAFADVVVLARELTLKQVAHISKEIKRKHIIGPAGQLVKLEVFVHGALCMAVSGKCYLSLHSQNASANRGACIQNCRRTYTVTDTETQESLLIDHEYIMSPKDLCTIDMLDQLLLSGISVLKIEGRSKGSDYVFTTTQCYREAINAIEDKAYTTEKIENWMKRLATVYNRGFWEGYYLGRKMGEWASQPGSVATEKKVYVGRGSKYYPRKKIGEFLIESGTVKVGDQLMISGPQLGMAREQMLTLTVNGVLSDLAVKGDKITFPVEAKITVKDKLYKIIDN
ncbi:MAG: U32 family peptidase [Sphingobacteriales bacterium]|nr:U32 family peptidase [Sphingobacteriales bacterium]